MEGVEGGREGAEQQVSASLSPVREVNTCCRVGFGKGDAQVSATLDAQQRDKASTLLVLPHSSPQAAE